MNPRCKYTIEDCKDHAISRHGLCLSTEYIDTRTRMLWQCSKGHQWQTRYNNIISKNSWCPKCSQVSKRTSITKLQQHAILKGGLLITIEYVNSNTKMLWQCSKGHQWFAVWHTLGKNNTWCPKCSTYKTENLAKEIMEKNLHMLFNKKRFYYTKQKFYELDGYNEDFNIAFEYQGIQHYKYVKHFHTPEKFKALQKRDQDKVKFCKDAGITLITIPYRVKNIEQYIRTIIDSPEIMEDLMKIA